MMKNFSATWSRRLISSVFCAGSALIAAAPASALLPQSWNGYKWARTGPLNIRVGDNMSSVWDGYLRSAATAWSGAANIDYQVVAGTAASGCGAVYGTLQVCNSDYGANGWLGYTNVWTSNGFIVQAVTKLNDYYFARANYNTAAWRQSTVCHELGHALGLAHADTIRTNLNIGSCLDYTNDPSGTLGKNGTLSNMNPGGNDFSALAGIYANLDGSQLSQTKFGAKFGMTGDGYYVSAFGAVPEASTWTSLILGFGIVGAAARRRRAGALFATA